MIPIGLLLLVLPVTFFLLPQPAGTPAERVLTAKEGLRGGEAFLHNGQIYSAQRINKQFCVVSRPVHGGRQRILARLVKEELSATRIFFYKDYALCLLRLNNRTSPFRGPLVRASTPSTKYYGEYLPSLVLQPGERREVMQTAPRRAEEPLYLWRIPLNGSDAQSMRYVGDIGYATSDAAAVAFLNGRILFSRPSRRIAHLVLDESGYRQERSGDILSAMDEMGVPKPDISEAVFTPPTVNSSVVAWFTPRQFPDRKRDLNFVIAGGDGVSAVKKLDDYGCEVAPVEFRGRVYWVQTEEASSISIQPFSSLVTANHFGSLRLFSARTDGSDRRMEPSVRPDPGGTAPYPLRILRLRDEAFLLLARDLPGRMQFGMRERSGMRPMEYGLLPLPLSPDATENRVRWMPTPYQGQECHRDGNFLYFVVTETRKNWTEIFSEATTAQMIDVLYRVPYPREASQVARN